MSEGDTTHITPKKIKHKTDDSIYQIHEYNIDLLGHQIFLFPTDSYANGQEEAIGEIGVEYTMASTFIRNINTLMMKDSSKPILIHMKTCGGDWHEGMAIHDAIKACPNPVIIVNYSHARSMSSIIFQAADKRVMMPNSTFMFHDGTEADSGTVKQVRSLRNFFDKEYKSSERMFKIYTTKMLEAEAFATERQALKYLKSEMDKKEDVYLTAERTVELGLADEIFGEDGCYDWDKLLKV